MSASVNTTQVSAGAEPETVEVAIVGAGFGGLCMAIQLLARGERSFVVLEKDSEVGGTWRDNQYPGAECDVQSHLYSYSFAPKADWSRRYAGWEEIQRYILDVTERYGLRPYVRCRQRVSALEFQEASARWLVSTQDGGTYAARHVVLATGPLHVPHVPGIPGLERFRGRVFHSARWDQGFEFAGKRVASIGTGGSAIQYCPQVAPRVSRLFVFQRTPAWVIPRDTRSYGSGTRRRFARFDWWRRLHRARLYWTNEARVWPLLHPALARAVQRVAAWHIRRAVGDARLARKLTPEYTIGCKRILVSNDWYPMFRRENVELVTDEIREVTETGIVTSDGQERAVDCIVLGTGFVVDPRVYMRDFPVRGLPGHELALDWRDGAEAYYGLAVSGFPNLHQLIGPNTALGHNSVIFMIEAQVRYVLESMRLLRERGADWLDVEPGAQAEFNARVQAGLRGTVWSSGCRSWYQQSDGKNFTIWPWSTWRYWLETRNVKVSCYRFGKALAAAGALATSLAVTACGERTTPEQQVRAVIATAEDAAERRDHGDLEALVSTRFEGAHGEDAREVSRLLRGYLVANPSIRVATRIERIDFPYEDLARVELTVGTLGRGGEGALDLDADAQSVELELQREGDDWRVTRAGWESAFAR